MIKIEDLRIGQEIYDIHGERYKVTQLNTNVNLVPIYSIRIKDNLPNCFFYLEEVFLEPLIQRPLILGYI